MCFLWYPSEKRDFFRFVFLFLGLSFVAGYGGYRQGAQAGVSAENSLKNKKTFFKYHLDKLYLKCYTILRGDNMTSKELITMLMREQNITNAEMAARLSITQAALWDRLNPKKSNNMTVKKMTDMLKMMDYKLVVVPRKSRVPSDGYEVD